MFIALAPDCSEADILRVRYPEVGIDVFQVPLEGLALQTRAQGKPLLNAGKTKFQYGVSPIKISVLIHFSSML